LEIVSWVGHLTHSWVEANSQPSTKYLNN
jgi:hypothetical protein